MQHRRRTSWILSGLVALASLAPLEAQDVEEILSYDVLVEVGSDSRLTVTEEITVRALGDEIRRGIYRDFPTSFPRATGLGRIEAPFEVLTVRKDGRDEPYELSSIGGSLGRGGMRIRIGDPDMLLEPGVYTYAITYETWRWIVFGERQDELYWNVTGNGWGFPIRSASARVRVPGLSIPPTLTSWTGPEGARSTLARASWDGTDARFDMAAELAPREGLTISVLIPTGLISEPPLDLQEAWFRLDWGGYMDAGYIVLLVLAVYLLMWRSVGVDPAPGPTVVQYEPPEGFSPAALGFLADRGYEQRQLAAAVVSLALKGALKIEQTKRKGWTLHLLDPKAEASAEERLVLNALFGSNQTIRIDPSNHAKVSKATKGLKTSLGLRLEREYFVNNRKWFALGVVVSLAGVGALAWRWRYGIEPPAWFLAVWLTLWTGGVTTLLYRGFTALGAAIRGGGFANWASGIGTLVFSIPFVGAELLVAFFLIGMVPTHLVLAVLVVGATNVLFYHLLERPTLRGRGVLDRLEGFRSFLSATDEDRLDRLNEPGRTPELFERFLPHAIALGLENRWAERFTWDLDPGRDMASPGGFAWYAGGGVAMNAASFSSSLGSSLSSTLSSSSSAPGSGSGGSGGGGGGGSSGGGGGGGGGGGW